MATDSTPLSKPASAADAPEAGPAPSFDQLPLSAEMRLALAEMGYEVPTPVQLAVWGPTLEGKDVVVQARTGTGKTAAFGLPIVDRLVRRSVRGVQALILCPTRELALQVSRELDQLGKHKPVSTVAIYGGASMPRQIDALSRGTPIVVGTPGRVLDHLRRGTFDPAATRTLVLDESDEMLSMGFEKELTAIMERLPQERQTLLFSATLPPDIERMVRSRLRAPEFLLLSGDHIGALEVSHYVYLVTQDKIGALVQVLEIENPESAVIFCNTREHTEMVALALQRHGFNADWLNGDLPQNEREQVMGATREGRLRFMVATDVAARGIDISHLTHVVNCDFPQDAEGYVHRTGRTGRAGRMGTAISLVAPQDIGALYILRLTYGLRPVERQLPTRGEQRTRLETDVVASLAETFAPRGRQSEHRPLARRLLVHDEAEAVIAGMLSEYLSARPGLAEAATTRRREWTPPPLVAAPSARPERAPRPRATPRPAPASAAASSSGDDVDAERPAPPPPVAPRAARTTRTTGESPVTEPTPEGGLTELYVNVGRKDGVRARDLKTLLIEEGGLPRESVGGVRVRDRCSFVEVESAITEQAIERLGRGQFGDRAVEAAVSERSLRGSPSAGDDGESARS